MIQMTYAKLHVGDRQETQGDMETKMPQVIQLEYTAGEFHCRSCGQICNYISNEYCCETAKKLTPQTKKCQSFFLKMCAYRLRLDRIVEGLVKGHNMVHPDGSCIFCRNKKHHNELKWCEKHTPMELYMHVHSREFAMMESSLDSFLAHRVSSKLEMIHNVQLQICKEMKETMQTWKEMTPSDIKLKMFQQRRLGRDESRQHEQRMVTENVGLRRSLRGVIRGGKDEHIAALKNVHGKSFIVRK